jgi:CRISPR type III-B/RAMP module-associated protein Cmr5
MAAAAAGMLPQTISDQLRTRYRQLPVMLRTAGLAATYAFLVAKADASELGRAYGKVADGIRQHLASRQLLPGDTTGLRNQDVVARLADAPLRDYTRAAAEVEALAGWLSRLAEAAHRSAAQGRG